MFMIAIMAFFIQATQASAVIDTGSLWRACKVGQKSACRDLLNDLKDQKDDASKERRQQALAQLCQLGDAPSCPGAGPTTSLNPMQKPKDPVLAKDIPRQSAGKCRRPVPAQSASSARALDLHAPAETDSRQCGGGCPEYSYVLGKSALAKDSSAELHVISVKSGPNSVGRDGNPTPIEVDVGPTSANTTLFLFSQNPTFWHISGLGSHRVNKIYLMSATSSTAMASSKDTQIIQLPFSGESANHPRDKDFTDFIHKVRLLTQLRELTFQGAEEGRHFSIPFVHDLGHAQNRQDAFLNAIASAPFEIGGKVISFTQNTRTMPKASTRFAREIFYWTGATLDLPDGQHLTPPAGSPPAKDPSGITFDSRLQRYVMASRADPGHFYIYEKQTRTWKVQAKPGLSSGLAYDPVLNEFWELRDDLYPKNPGQSVFNILNPQFKIKRTATVTGPRIAKPESGIGIQMQFIDTLLVVWKNDHSGVYYIDPGCLQVMEAPLH